MAEGDDQESKTEDASGRRLQEARSRGQVPKTQEMPHLFALAAVWVLVVSVLPWSFGGMVDVLTPFIERPESMATDRAAIGHLLVAMVLAVGPYLVVPLVLLIFAGVMASVVQVGFLFSTETLFQFNLDRFNPITNLRNRFNAKGLVEFAKSLVKLLVVSAVVMPALFPLVGSVDHFINLPLLSLVAETQHLAAGLVFRTVLVLAALAGGDYAYQRWKFAQDMKMTKQEVKDEHKQSEGDPQIKGKLRQLRMQRARNRMMEKVPKADVVVTNPTHYAVALQYNAGSMSAPVVLAKGMDFIALRIREIAQENDIPLVENPPLARALYATAELDQPIPTEHYKAVAQVISYVLKLRKQRGGKR